MFVDRTPGVVVVAIAALALSACADPNENTQLRPEGPPEVLAVLVMADAVDHLVETATFCKLNDDKRPGLVGLPDFTTQQICDEDLSVGADEVENAYPDGWYVRIMFDELLDPSVEELIEVYDDAGQPTDTYYGTLVNTRPVILECESVTGSGMVNVDYDGYYSPAGNRLTWPLGPSLVIKPNDVSLIATNTKCQVTIKDSVRDKQGEVVPADQRGPYTFRTSPIEILYIEPFDDPDGLSPLDAIALYYDNVYVQFNTEVDVDSVCPDEEGTGLCDAAMPAFRFTPDPGGYCAVSGDECTTSADCDTSDPDDLCETTYAYSLAPFGLSKAELAFGPILPLETEKDYTFSFSAGAKLRDRCGAETTFGAPAAALGTLVRFTTAKFGIQNINIAHDETASPLKKPTLRYNNVVDPSTLGLSDWTLVDEDGEPPFIPPSETVCTSNTDCAAFRGGECRTFGAPTNGMRCVSTHTTTPFHDGDFVFRGHYKLGKAYTLTLKANAMVADAYGVVHTNAADRLVTWKTQPAINLTALSPSNNGVINKAAPTASSAITLTFNQAMDAATLTEDDYTITPAVALTTGVASSSDCTASGTTCRLRLTGVFPAGTYTFTLKKDAEITDMLGNVYTQPADRVINFTVRETPPVPQPACL
jgi:hypothetical protein